MESTPTIQEPKTCGTDQAIVSRLVEWSAHGVMFDLTHPDPSIGRWYVKKFVPRNSGTGRAVWKFLYDDGWQWNHGCPWSSRLGKIVNCPTFEKWLEAVSFATDVEQRFGSLIWKCPQFGFE